MVYIGDRADSSVCAIDEQTLARKACGHIDSTPDGVVYVAPTKEVWVTAPRDKSVRILDSQTLTQKEKLTFEGQPEGYAVDAKRGRLYMNYEDKDLTTAIDLKTRKTVAKWPSSCGEDGPHGLSVDQDAGFLFVACSTQAEVLDAGHNGEKLSSIDTGDGVDDLHYSPATHMLYVGAAKDARLTIARVDAAGKLSLIAQVPTHEGARNGVVTKDGTVYLAHSQRGQLAGLIVVSPSQKIAPGPTRTTPELGREPSADGHFVVIGNPSHSADRTQECSVMGLMAVNPRVSWHRECRWVSVYRRRTSFDDGHVCGAPAEGP